MQNDVLDIVIGVGVVRTIVIRHDDSPAEGLAMHEVNWCVNCGSIIRTQLPQVARDGRTELVDHLVCDCRGRPRPAEKDGPKDRAS